MVTDLGVVCDTVCASVRLRCYVQVKSPILISGSKCFSFGGDVKQRCVVLDSQSLNLEVVW